MDATRARRIYELMVLTAWADGHVHPTEATAIREIAAALPELKDLGDRLEISRAAKERLDQKGLDAAVREAAMDLADPAERELAFRCCAKVLEADGEVEGEEAEVLAILQEVFSLTSEDVQRLLHRLEG